MNPLVMLVAISFSIVLSIILVFIDVASPPVSNLGKKAMMRQKIEDMYFGSRTLEEKPLESYQILLREAEQSRLRHDLSMERERYRKVLDMLRAERRNEERGLTGSRSKDRDLEEAVTTLLDGG